MVGRCIFFHIQDLAVINSGLENRDFEPEYITPKPNTCDLLAFHDKVSQALTNATVLGRSESRPR